MDATRQTAAGVTLGDDRFDPQEPLDPFDFREPSDPDRRPLLSRLPLLSFLRLSFLSLPRELRDPERAGVALRGFCLPAWENSHSLPLLQRPAFQYLHVILDLIVFTLPTRRTTSTWFSSFLRRSLVFVRAVFFGATALVPCDTVPLWGERSFLPREWTASDLQGCCGSGHGSTQAFPSGGISVQHQQEICRNDSQFPLRHDCRLQCHAGWRVHY